MMKNRISLFEGSNYEDTGDGHGYGILRDSINASGYGDGYIGSGLGGGNGDSDDGDGKGNGSGSGYGNYSGGGVSAIEKG